MPPVATRIGNRYTGLRAGSVRRAFPGTGLAAGRHADVETVLERSGEIVLFRRLMRDLIESASRDRPAPFRRVVDHIRQSAEPIRCVNDLLDELANDSGQDGLDLGVDVLSQVGGVAIAAVEAFTVADSLARSRPAKHVELGTAMPIHDEVWYMLLRGAARAADVSDARRLSALIPASKHPSVAVRVSWIEALGDLYARPGRGPSRTMVMTRLLAHLREVARGEKGHPVRDAAGAVLESLGA